MRVSTADQGERYSLDSQLDRIRRKAKDDNTRIRDEWIFRDCHTGKLASRPDFDALKALVRTSQPDAVYIYDVSRFARKTLDALWLKAEFKRYGVELRFVELPFEDNAAGRMMFTQMASMAEYMGAKILEDSRRGTMKCLEMGRLTHGSAPYGYRYADSAFHLDESDSNVPGITKAQVIRWIYEWRRKGTPVYRIATMLNDRGIRSAGRIGKGGVKLEGAPWSRQTVHQALNNPTYCGRHLRSGVTIQCPALVEPELWEAVQTVNVQSKVRNNGRPSRKYLLRGFVRCSLCGHRVITGGGHGHNGVLNKIYRCGHLRPSPFERYCFAPGVNTEVLDNAAWRAVWDLLRDPKTLYQLAHAEMLMQASGADAGGILQQERDTLTAQIARLRRMVKLGTEDEDTGNREILERLSRVREIEAELDSRGRVLELPPLQLVEANARNYAQGPEPSTYDRRRDILEGIVDLDMVYRRDVTRGPVELTITGKVPLPETGKKCNKGFTTYYTSDPCIPFTLKVLVA